MGWGVEAKEIKGWLGGRLESTWNLCGYRSPYGRFPQDVGPQQKTQFVQQKQGIDFIVVTGNPGTGVTMEAIITSVRRIERVSLGMI